MRSVEYIEEVTMPSILTYLQEAEDAGNSPATPTKGWYCAFCGYKDICPAFT
jgi:CRISPR/Cas system-associated exonuclease Cas4 (RecB family)